ncbi:hypothetical protein GCM10022226_37620 [Sphaerisporangium flaviroseum]|uniref:DUF6884 domain-containing protein n=2 Tax=Sphaerisporangium flaviroseum TaxID=509199 RepID=A0ABP7IA31_9ACTN
MPRPAEDLYVSPLFQLRRRYVERSCERWYILSALHGLVDRTTVLEPYDKTLTTASRGERREWSRLVLRQLTDRLMKLEGHVFEVHAGAAYYEFGLREGLQSAGAVVEIPTQGRSLGRTLAFYSSSF